MEKQTFNRSRLACLMALFSVLLSFPLMADDRVVLVETSAVVEQSVSKTLSTFGVLDTDPDQVFSLSLPHAGLINRVWIRTGQRVKAGDKLIEIITAPDAHMQYLQAQSSVDYAQLEVDRQTRLLEGKLTTRGQVDAARKNLKDSYATLEALKKRGLGQLEDTMLAPIDGVVTRLDVSQGQRVQSDSSALLIASETRLIARLGVEPEDLSQVEVGTELVIKSVFSPDLEIHSSVREVHAMINPDTRLVEVLASIPEEQVDKLILGSRITAELSLETHQALLVPRSAVLYDGQQAYLFVVKDGKAKRLEIQAGLSSGKLIEVRGKVELNDQVVTLGSYELSDGMLVKVAP